MTQWSPLLLSKAKAILKPTFLWLSGTVSVGW